MSFPLSLVTASAVLALSASAHAGMHPDDVLGSADHPLISRFEGARLLGYRSIGWDSVAMPAPGVASGNGNSLQTLEGKVTRLAYVTPVGKSPLEVFRNHEQALAAAGFKRVVMCESKCNDLYRAWITQTKITNEMSWRGYITTPSGNRYSADSGPSSEQGRLLYGTLSRGTQTAHILLYTSVAAYNSTEQAHTLIQIVEPRPMPMGQVTVNAATLDASMQNEGKVALYGLFFETGKATIQSESMPQLMDMARWLKEHPQANVYIVGHTDNVGMLDANQRLALARAQAVVQALSQAPYLIEAKRLSAQSVGSLAPVANNLTDDGRGRNRRVEMVLQ